jgi:hypothetical protein
MGSELELDINEPRFLQVLVAGTSTLESITIVRNNKNLFTKIGKSMIEKFQFIDKENLSDILLTTENTKPFVFYYIRVIQEDWEMGWSSPIWITVS